MQDDIEDQIDDSPDVFEGLTPGAMPVSELVGDDIQRVSPEASLREVCAALSRQGVGVLGVGEDGAELAGVLSERDIVKALAAGLDPDAATADQVKTERILYVDPAATVDEVAAEMLTKWTRHLLVGRPDELLGVVSARDILGVYSSGSGTA